MDDPRCPLCPSCGAETLWEFTDRFKAGEAILIERQQVCSNWCGWFGYVALFPVDMKKLALVPLIHPNIEDSIPYEKAQS